MNNFKTIIVSKYFSKFVERGNDSNETLFGMNSSCRI